MATGDLDIRTPMSTAALATAVTLGTSHPAGDNGSAISEGTPVIEVMPGDIGTHHIRLAISPIEEVLHALRTLNRPGRSPVHARWAVANRQALASLEVDELVELVSGDIFFPDFLSPAPADRSTTIEDQLEALVHAPAEQVRAEITLSMAGRDATPLLTNLLDDPTSARDLLAAQLRRCWDVLVKPMWPRLRDVLAADVDHRARQFGEGGLVEVLTGIYPGVTVRGPRILLPSVQSARIELDERGLQLVPSVFTASLGVMLMPPSLVYPARGSATLWQDVPPSDTDPLAGVVGRTKARLLRELATPASTTVLADRLGVAPSTISQHVKALAAAGLLESRRAGRSVHYRRSSLGDELVSSAT